VNGNAATVRVFPRPKIRIARPFPGLRPAMVTDSAPRVEPPTPEDPAARLSSAVSGGQACRFGANPHAARPPAAKIRPPPGSLHIEVGAAPLEAGTARPRAGEIRPDERPPRVHSCAAAIAAGFTRLSASFPEKILLFAECHSFARANADRFMRYRPRSNARRRPAFKRIGANRDAGNR